MKKRDEAEVLRKIQIGAVREEQKRQGFFDGRFVVRTMDSKKRYKRTEKHKTRY